MRKNSVVGIVCDVTTAYGHYQVVDTIYAGRPARMLYSDNQFAAQSGLARDDAADLLFDYIQRFMELIRGLKPKRILMIGAGAYTLPKSVIEEFPDIQLDIVEIDSELIDIAKEYFGFAPSKNTRLFFADGKDFVKDAKNQYDLILMDAFIETTIPPQLQTEDFVDDLARLFATNGVFAMNIIGAYKGLRSSAIKRQADALQAEFKYLQIFPAMSNISLWMAQNFIITASKQKQDLNRYIRYASITDTLGANELLA